MGEDIKKAALLLKANELVAIPTETVYGLAANALNDEAVMSIFEAKQRPSFNPLIVHVKDIDTIADYAYIDDISLGLARKFMPGPFTLLLRKKPIISDLVTAGSDKVAIRIPDHPMTLELLKSLPFPLAAPSANMFGYVSPTTAAHVRQGLGKSVAYILDGGPCGVGLESTIVEVSDDQIILHRTGAVTAADIEVATGLQVVLPQATVKPVTSGQLKSHYATNIPLIRGDIQKLIALYQGKKIATISFSRSYTGIVDGHQYILSPKGDLHEAARNLFAVMRCIDEFEFDVILTELFPDEGLGKAINDRLERAQSKHK